MKRIRILGVCLGLVLAVSVVAGATNAAAVSWEQCVKISGPASSLFTDKSCTTTSPTSHGKYELLLLGPDPAFKGKGGIAVLHTVVPGKGDVKVECSSFKVAGNIVAPRNETGVVAELKGCKALAAPCQNGSTERITTNVLAGELGYISKPSVKVGIELTNEAAPGSGLLAEFQCTGLAKMRVHGALIGEELGIVNHISKTSQVAYTVGPYLGTISPGYTPLTNRPAFEGGPTMILLTESEQGTGWEPAGGLPSGLEATAVLKHPSLGIHA
jgi:hypothetical protein